MLGFGEQAQEIDDCGVQVRYLRRSRVRKLGVFINLLTMRRYLRHLCSRGEIDLIEATESSLPSVPADLKVPTVVRLQGSHRFIKSCVGERPRFLTDAFQHRSLKRAKIIVGVSQFVTDQTLRIHDLHPQVSVVIPSIVDTDLFSSSDEVTSEKDLIVFAGTLYRFKGVYQLIEAMRIILSKRPEARLIMAGKDGRVEGGLGSVTEDLKSQMSSDLAPKVRFQGPVPHEELAKLYSGAAVCVFPSLKESFGIVAIEAMACGRPVVFMKTGPGPEIIEDGVSGLLCDTYSPSDIAEKILCILDDPALGQRLGRNARERVLQKFSADVVVRKNIAFYEQCLSSSST